MASKQPVDDDREALLCALQQAGVESCCSAAPGLVVKSADRSQDLLPAGYFTAASIAPVAIWNLGTLPHLDIVVATAAGSPAAMSNSRRSGQCPGPERASQTASPPPPGATPPATGPTARPDAQPGPRGGCAGTTALTGFDINRVTISGNLTDNPDLRTFPNGNRVTNLRIANNTRKTFPFRPSRTRGAALPFSAPAQGVQRGR